MKAANYAVLAALGMAAPVGASAMDVTIGPKAGTLGYGLEVAVGGERVKFRLSHTQMSRSESETYDGIDYDLDLDWSNTAALVDWHVFGGGFRLSAGLASNGNDFVATAPEQSYQVGNGTYTVGLQADLDFDSAAPYVGLGWGKNGKGWGFGFDVGVLFQGSPGVNLTASGDPLIIGDPTFQADLERERQALEDDISEFDLYPVAAIAVTYTF